MWSAVIPATTAALVWILLDVVAFIAVYRGWGVRLVGRWSRPLLIILAIALLVRLVPALLLPVGARYDIESFRLVGAALLNGEEVYTSAARNRHPYLPLQMIWIGSALWSARHTAVPFVVWLKLPAVLADVAITAVLFKTLQRRADTATAVTLVLLFALNPVSVLITAYHGQFDALPTLLLLLAWVGWELRRTSWSAVALGLATLSKTWPALFWPIVVMRQQTWRQRVTYTTLALGIPAAAVVVYVLLFQADPLPMLRRTLAHTGVPGYWGVSAVLSILSRWSPLAAGVYDILLALRHVLLLVAALVTLWWTRRQPALDALLALLLAELAVSVGIGIQWLVWLVPFGLLARETRWSVRYALAALILLLVQLYGLHLHPWAYIWLARDTATAWIRLASLPVWGVVVAWLFVRLRRERSAPQPRLTHIDTLTNVVETDGSSSGRGRM